MCQEVKLHDVLTVSLGGVGVIDHVVNNTGARRRAWQRSRATWPAIPEAADQCPTQWRSRRRER